MVDKRSKSYYKYERCRLLSKAASLYKRSIYAVLWVILCLRSSNCTSNGSTNHRVVAQAHEDEKRYRTRGYEVRDALPRYGKDYNDTRCNALEQETKIENPLMPGFLSHRIIK